MIIFKRTIEPKIKELLFKKRAILIFGPRQAGKTTLAKNLIESFGDEGSYFNCEELAVRNYFSIGDPQKLKSLVGNKKIVVFDEAQTIQNIGSILKVFIDTYPNVQLIATGSSSFDLANKINEPLTGRSFEFILYPLSIAEIKQSGLEVTESDMYELLRLGSYPAIVTETDISVRANLLKNIATNYLYKDIFIFESIKNPKVFEDLIKMLAFQVGSLVSVNELSSGLGVSRHTIDKYLRLLEQAYIIKRLYSFSRNHRNEIKKAFKVYFIDNGIRNVVAELTDNNISERNDKGALLENFFFSEKLKNYSGETFPPRLYFWRTVQKEEIDFVEVKGNEVRAYEGKWNPDIQPSFKSFLKKYPNTPTNIVSINTFYEDK